MLDEGMLDLVGLSLLSDLEKDFLEVSNGRLRLDSLASVCARSHGLRALVRVVDS